jgi:hypothetical protein
MKTTRATGTVSIMIDHNLDDGEISAVRIIASRDDQERAALELAREITRPSIRARMRKLFSKKG